MAPDPVSAIGLRVTVGLIQHIAPKGIARVRSWLRGKEVLVVGQSRAGKSTFVDYLRFGIFGDEQETHKTVDVEATPTFAVRVGRQSSLELEVKRAVDVPGQIGATEHAKIAFERRPHGLVIVTDSSTPLEGESDRAAAAWLEEFLEALDAKWAQADKRRNRLRSVIVLANKADKLESDPLKLRVRELRKVVRRIFRDARGRRTRPVSVLPCITVSNPQGTTLVDTVIVNLAKELVD